MEENIPFPKKFYEKLLHDYDVTYDHSGIVGKRLASRLAKLSEIGLTSDDGSDRMGFSMEEKEAKNLVKEWMMEAGLHISVDGAGNVFGRLEGKSPHAPAILSGSHVDSVPNGGHFDGPLGVLAALEVVEAWRTTGYVPNHPYEVVIFTDEEGARFKGGLLGSSAIVGDNEREKLMELVDVNGHSFEQVINDYDLSVNDFFQCKRDLKDIAAFIEVHIEQGKRLEKENLPVGFVNGIAGPCWLEMTFEGKAGHAGNTPMNDRMDALVAASEFINGLESLPSNISPSAVATVGQLNVYPNGVNVIPGKVVLTVDIRDIYLESRDQLVHEVISLGKEVASKRLISLDINETIRISPVLVNSQMQKIATSAINKLGFEAKPIPSGAGHDAMILGRYIPASMLFVRSKNGISHNPDEWTDLTDCIIGIHALKNMIEELDRA